MAYQYCNVYISRLTILHAMQAFRLPEGIDLAFTRHHHLLRYISTAWYKAGRLSSHLLRHVVDLRPGTIVHHRVCEHEEDIALELKRVRDEAILDA